MNNDFLLNLYENLNSEMRNNSQITATAFTVSMTATATIIGFGIGIEAATWPFFLAPFAVLVPTQVLIISQMQSTITKAAYIATVIEKNIDSINWENDWIKFRSERGRPSRTMWNYSASIAGMYLIVSMICWLLAISRLIGSFEEISIAQLGQSVLFTLISCVLLLAQGILSWKLFAEMQPGAYYKKEEAWTNTLGLHDADE